MLQGFFIRDQIILRGAATTLKVHTISDIMTLDVIKIKKRVINGVLYDLIS